MRFCLIVIFSLFVSGLRAQEPSETPDPSSKGPYVEREEKQIKFYPGGKIDIATAVPGSIRIMGWQKSSVQMEAEKIIYYFGPEEAKALIEEYPIKVRYTETNVIIGISGPSPPDATVEINLTFHVPRDRTDLNIKAVQSDCIIDSLNGWIEVTAGEGSLEATSMSGYFAGTTKRGDIHVEMSGRRWRGLEFAAVTQMGSIDLLLPAEYDARVQLETRNGKLDVDYPPRLVDGELVPLEVSVGEKGQSLDSDVGDGGAPIKLITHFGDVRFSQKGKPAE
jgi:hypothetical protein